MTIKYYSADVKVQYELLNKERNQLERLSHGPTMCREFLIDYIRTDMRTNRYSVMAKEIKGKYSNSTIYLIVYNERFRYKRPLDVKRIKDTYLKLFYPILTALNGDPEEKKRLSKVDMKTKYKIDSSGKSYYSTDLFTIENISSFYLVSPPLVSLITGLARDILSVIAENMDKEYLDNIDSKEVYNIVHTHDRRKAIQYYNDIILTFWKNNNDFSRREPLLTDKQIVSSISELINNTSQSVFIPKKHHRYWDRYSMYYGVKRFSNYINNPNSVRLYDNYRKI